MKPLSPIAAAALLLAGFTAQQATATVIAHNDFSGDTVAPLAFIQAGRDVADGQRPVGQGFVTQQDGVLKLPGGDRYYTAVRGLLEMPETFTIQMQFRYTDISTANCSFGLTWSDLGSESALPNQGIRMGLGIDGPGWKLIAGRREAWAAVQSWTLAQPVVANDIMTLTIERTSTSLANINLVSTANGTLLNETAVDYSTIGMQGEFGQMSIYNAAFGGSPYNPVEVLSVVVEDSGSNVIFADDFEGAEIDTTKWLRNINAIPLAAWPESFPNRPVLVGNQLRLQGQSPTEARYARAPLNTDIVVSDFLLEAEIEVTDGTAPDAFAESIFGVKFRNQGDESTSIVCAIDPINNLIKVGENVGATSLGNAQEAAFTVGTGDTFYLRVVGQGNTVTMSVGPNANTITSTVTKSNFAGNFLNPGGVIFFVTNVFQVRVNSFVLNDDPAATTNVADWYMF